MRHRLHLLVLIGLALLPAGAAGAFDLCGPPPPPGGPRIQLQQLDLQTGTRFFCEFLPSSYGTAGAGPHPLVLVFHGGNGNPTRMMRGKGLIQEAEARGYVALFVAGTARPDRCPQGGPCENNIWGPDENLAFVPQLLAKVLGNYDVAADRVFLAGFSGGARLIYRLLEANNLGQDLRGIATAAGSLGDYEIADPAAGISIINVGAGLATNAVIMQGEDDPKMPFRGGFAANDPEIHVSFRFKRDLFRVLTGNEQTQAQSFTQLPSGARGELYDGGRHQLLVISGDERHTWPSWLSPIVFEFFDRL